MTATMAVELLMDAFYGVLVLYVLWIVWAFCMHFRSPWPPAPEAAQPKLHPYNAGRRAFAEGKALASNPYTLFGVQPAWCPEAWEEGWRASERESGR